MLGFSTSLLALVGCLGVSAFFSVTEALLEIFGAALLGTGLASAVFFLVTVAAICLVAWDFAALTVGFSGALTGADLALAVSSAGFAGLADEMGVLFRAVHKPLSSTQKGT